MATSGQVSSAPMAGMTDRSSRTGKDADALDHFLDDLLGDYQATRSSTRFHDMRQAADAIVRAGASSPADLSDPGLIDRCAANDGWDYLPEATRTHKRNYLRILIRHAVRRGLIPSDPYEGRPWPQTEARTRGRLVAATPGQVSALLAHLRAGAGDWTTHRLYAVVGVIAYRGLRPGQFLGLRVDAFDLRDRCIRTRRPLAIPKPLVAILDAWLPRAGSSYAFPRHPSKRRSCGDGAVRYPPLARQLTGEARAAGLAGIRAGELLRFGLRFSEAHSPDLGPQGAPASYWPRSPAVALAGPDDPPAVLGEEMPRLKPTWRVAIELLLEAGPDGLLSGELRRRCELRELSDPFRVIRELRKDSRWGRAIATPGKAHGGHYRIRTRDEFVDTSPARPENSQT